MRKLNKKETEILQKISGRCRGARCLKDKDIRVHYQTADDGMTVAELSFNDGRARRFGVSKYNKIDKKLGLPFSEEIGQQLAFSRAVRS